MLRGLRTEAPYRRRVRDAEGDERGGEWGRGIHLPSRLAGLGERRKLPQRSAENGFWGILSLKKNVSGDDKFVIFGHFIAHI